MLGYFLHDSLIICILGVSSSTVLCCHFKNSHRTIRIGRTMFSTQLVDMVFGHVSLYSLIGSLPSSGSRASACASSLGLRLGTKGKSLCPCRRGTANTEAPVSPNKGVRHHSCKITERMKFIREVYLYSWLDAPMVSMGMGRAAQ